MLAAPSVHLAFAQQVSELLDVLDRRTYIYPNGEVDKTADAKPGYLWLPVLDVMNTFTIYRPIGNRNHKKSYTRNKMVYRGEGWDCKGGIFQCTDDDAIVWLMSDERLTIDNIVDSKTFQNKKYNSVTTKTRSPAFLLRNIRDTKNSYPSEAALIEDLNYEGIDPTLWEIKVPSKRRPRRTTQRSKRRRVK